MKAFWIAIGLIAAYFAGVFTAGFWNGWWVKYISPVFDEKGPLASFRRYMTEEQWVLTPGQATLWILAIVGAIALLVIIVWGVRRIFR
jgi:hypothetical protein